ncbi:MAG: hypothetical protein HZB68_03350 [Candidatus Aenigmarchaeota archaeon]|nr:hypothetical protein [Candidatus Aenigmarchaeota archaeon]
MDGVVRDEKPALKVLKKGEMKKSLAMFKDTLAEAGLDDSPISSLSHLHGGTFTYAEWGDYKASGRDRHGDSFTISFNETKNTAKSLDELLGEKGYIESVFCSVGGKCKSLKKEGMGIKASGPTDRHVSSAQAVLMPNGDLEIIVYSQRPGFYKSEIEKLCDSLNEKLKAYGTKAEMV